MSRKKLFILLVLVRLPYLLMEYPGCIYPDTAGSIEQFFGYSDFSAQLCTTDPTIVLTNHHPVIYTLLFGGVIALGNLIGSQGLAVFLYLTLQTLLHAWVLSNLFILLCPTQASSSKRLWWLCLAFTALFPVYGFWCTMMLKDAVFSIAFLSLTLYLLEIVFSQGDKLKESGFLIRFMFITFLFMLSKNQCIYIVWLLIPAVLLFRQKGKWRMTGSLLVPALAYMLFLHLLLPALHVAPVGRQEFHGFMFQQTALYLKEHPADVRAEERKAIAALLPYERIAQLYDPDCQDPVKFSYNVAASDEDFSRYRTAHLHMMLRHPDIALKSLWQGCNAFFYPSARFPIFFPLLATDAPPRPDFYDLHPLFHPQPSGMKTALSLPVPLRWLFDVGFYIPLAFIGCVILLFKGKILPFLPVLISIGILVLSPENGCFRYAMPIIWLLPFLPLFIVLPPDNKIPRHAPLRHHTGL